MAEPPFDAWVAQNYSKLWPELFHADVLRPTVEALAELAGGGRALEFGIGTGRVALPLAGVAGSRWPASSCPEPWSTSYADRAAPR